MSSDPDDSWVAWGNVERMGGRQKSTGAKKDSKFWRHWETYNAIHCCVRVRLPHRTPNPNDVALQTEDWELFKNAETGLKVAFGGGSDTPQLRIVLKHIPTEQTATISFSSWSREQPREAATRVVNEYPNDPGEEPRSFSMQLRDMAVRRLDQYPQLITDRDAFSTTGGLPLSLNWNVSQRPTGMNLEFDGSAMSPDSIRLFSIFRQTPRAVRIMVLAHGNRGFWDSWAYFAAQPSPTPPPWWRYTTKTEPHQLVLEDLEDISTGTDLQQHHSNQDGRAIVPMVSHDQFLDAREYEVFIVGSLLREKEAQDRLYVDGWNHRYDFSLQDVQSVASRVSSAKSYIITMRITLRNMSTDDENAPLPPDVGTDVHIQDSFDFQFSGTISAVDPGPVVTMIVTKTKGTGAMILNERNGRFRFGNPGHPYVGAMKAIQLAMHNEPIPGHVNWLQKVLLAHENKSIMSPNAPRVAGAWQSHFPPLNAEQEIALAQSCFRGTRLGDRINMIQGPPGTGKTTVIGQIAIHNLSVGRKFLVVAETRFAVQVAAQAITAATETAQMVNARVFVVQHAGAEGMEYDMDEPYEDMGAPRSPHITADDETPYLMSEATRSNVAHNLEQLKLRKVESLTTYINARINMADEDPTSLPRNEALRLLQFIAIRNDRNDPSIALDVAEDAYKAYKKAWMMLQEFYIEHHAMGVVVTASSTMTRVLRKFRPEHVIVDEASQVAEHAAVPVLAKFFHTAKKFTLIGDPSQGGPFHVSPDEFVKTTMKDLMSRMIASGLPITMLKVQYRMHPDISTTVSRFFYQGLLTDHPSVVNRPGNQLWRLFLEQSVPTCRGQHSIFIGVDPGVLYRTVQGGSTVNARHIVVVRQAVARLKVAGARNEDIAILTPYKAQLRIHMTMENAAGITMGTVDGSQGREYDYIILDLVTHGASGSALGFVTDVRRMCLALSRAKFGLMIVGNRYMGENHHQNLGVRFWGDIIEQHVGRGAFGVRNPTPADVANVVRRHGLGGNRYVRA